jgi:F0F1-type ATP synthase gamma subunit
MPIYTGSTTRMNETNISEKNKYIDNSIYCYSTRNKFNSSLTFEKQLQNMLAEVDKIDGRKNQIRHVNNIFDLIRRNKLLLMTDIRFEQLKTTIQDKILEFYHTEKLYRLANEWHYWIFDTYIRV